MARYKLTFADSNTGETYLLDDNMPNYDSAVFSALDYVKEGVDRAEEEGDAVAAVKLFNAGLSMAIEFSEKKGLDYVSCCGFTITKVEE